MIIEIDGLHHQLPENKEADEVRTQWLNQQSFKVIRFTNKQVLHKTEETINAILTSLKDRPGIKETKPPKFCLRGTG